MWTLEYDGTEKSFEAWGLSETKISRTRTNMAPDILSVTAPGLMDATTQFAYGQPVIIRRDRTVGEGFTGGTIYFRGRALTPRRMGSGNAEEISYSFAGPWWDFERVVFQQSWKTFGGYTDPDDPTTEPVLNDVTTSEVMLAQDTDGTKLTTGEQIEEAVKWAIGCGVPVQLGTVDPALDIPIYNARDLTVAEVIRQMLRWTPDVTVWFDYATSPPTMQVRELANMVERTVTPGTYGIKALSLKPRYDLVLPAVLIRFKQLNSLDGQPWVNITTDKAPVGATGLEFGASVHTIDIFGIEQKNVYGKLECVAVGAQAGTNADRVSWWKTKEPLFNTDKIKSSTLTITSAVITDNATGDSISLATWPNELVDGQVADWMKLSTGTAVAVKSVTVKARAEYELYRDAGNLVLTEKRTKELSVRIKVTNGITGPYSDVDSVTPSEPIPVGLAAGILAAHSVLQHEGEITLVGTELASTLGMGDKVTVDTGTMQFDDMLVQSVVEDLGAGTMTLSVGPCAHLGVSDLIELLRVNRNRLTWQNPSTRNTAKSGGGSVRLGEKVPAENTTAGLGDKKFSAVTAEAETGKTTVIHKDAEDQALTVHVVNNATGTRDTSKGSIVLKLAQTIGSDLEYHDVYLQEGDVCVNGTIKKAIILMSDPYDAIA